MTRWLAATAAVLVFTMLTLTFLYGEVNVSVGPDGTLYEPFAYVMLGMVCGWSAFVLLIIITITGGKK